MPKRAKDILGYFVRNPHAADSLEGVARWRLLEEVIHQNVDETRDALRWLVTCGFLREDTVPGAAPVFSLNHEKIAEAERLIGGTSSHHRKP